MKAKLILFLISILFFSCTDSNYKVDIEELCDPEIVYKHAISEDSALSYLNIFLRCSDGISSRAQSTRTSKTIYPIPYISKFSRSSTNNITDCQNLLYVANFNDNNGYAILAADDRIKEKVIAIVDDGNLDYGIMQSVIEDIDNDEDDVDFVPGYPSDSDKFFYTSECMGEMFLNPNVSMYDETEQDNL